MNCENDVPVCGSKLPNVKFNVLDLLHTSYSIACVGERKIFKFFRFKTNEASFSSVTTLPLILSIL